MIPDRIHPIFNHTGHRNGCAPFLHSDPLRFSPRCTLPFPGRAAATLAEQRGKRFDDLAFPIEEVERRFRELASVMGLLSSGDDMPTAA